MVVSIVDGLVDNMVVSLVDGKVNCRVNSRKLVVEIMVS